MKNPTQADPQAIAGVTPSRHRSPQAGRPAATSRSVAAAETWQVSCNHSFLVPGGCISLSGHSSVDNSAVTAVKGRRGALEHAKDPVYLINGHACRDLLTLGVLFLKGHLDPQ